MQKITEGVLDYDVIDGKPVFAIVSFNKQQCRVQTDDWQQSTDELLSMVGKAVQITSQLKVVGLKVDDGLTANFLDPWSRLPFTDQELQEIEPYDVIEGLEPAKVRRNVVSPELRAAREAADQDWRDQVNQRCRGGLKSGPMLKGEKFASNHLPDGLTPVDDPDRVFKTPEDYQAFGSRQESATKEKLRRAHLQPGKVNNAVDDAADYSRRYPRSVSERKVVCVRATNNKIRRHKR